jgi:hypothetical protein
MSNEKGAVIQATAITSITWMVTSTLSQTVTTRLTEMEQTDMAGCKPMYLVYKVTLL